MSDDVDLVRRFSYHAPDALKVETHQLLREEFLSLAEEVHTICPPGRERSLAFTKLEEALFWVNAAIARSLE